MRRTRRSGGFFICLLINIILNLDGAIPGVLLLIGHYAFGVPLWLAIAAFALWFIGMIVYMLIMGWYIGQDDDLPQKSKKVNNPYAKKGVIIKDGKVIEKVDEKIE